MNRLDAPDTRLRMIAIKQMQGQALNPRELKRLAQRQGVEANHGAGKSDMAGSMDGAYKTASAPNFARAYAHASGGEIGTTNARYGEGSLPTVQGLNRERLLREKVLGNLSIERNKLALGDEKLRSGYLPKQLERQEELNKLQLADAAARAEYLPKDLANKEARDKVNLDKERLSLTQQQLGFDRAEDRRKAVAIVADANRNGGKLSELDYQRLKAFSPELAAETAYKNTPREYKWRDSDGKEQTARFVGDKRIFEPRRTAAIETFEEIENELQGLGIRLDEAIKSGNDAQAEYIRKKINLLEEYRTKRYGKKETAEKPNKADEFIKDAVSGSGANAEKPAAEKTKQQKFWRM
nr:MAG TPA: hypothetical protein [Caudoviricetes sp.]